MGTRSSEVTGPSGMMPPQSSDGADLMRPNGKVVVVVAGYPILTRGLTARFAWELRIAGLVRDRLEGLLGLAGTFQRPRAPAGLVARSAC